MTTDKYDAVQKAYDDILSDMKHYAFLAYSWDMDKEEDLTEFTEAIKQHLINLAEVK